MEFQQLTESIKSCLTTLTSEEFDAIIEKLNVNGVNSMEDVKYVVETDLLSVLKPIQARRLTDSWNKKGMIFKTVS